MKKITYVVSNPRGIHARPCALLAQCCTNFKSSVTVSANEETASAQNILELLALHAAKGDILNIQIEGEDEEQALSTMIRLVEDGLGE